jgi:integrase
MAILYSCANISAILVHRLFQRAARSWGAGTIDRRCQPVLGESGAKIASMATDPLWSPTSKSRKERVVPISLDIAKVFRDWRGTQMDPKVSDPVLPWPHDDHNNLYEDWHAIQTTAGMPKGDHYVPKNCRSTCASALIAANVPTVVVKDFLGHATVATTENYYINTKPALRAAATARKVRLEDGDAEKGESVDGNSADAKGGPNEKL